MSLLFAVCANHHCLFSDTEIIEYPLQDILGIGSSDDDPQLVQRDSEVKRDELRGKILP